MVSPKVFGCIGDGEADDTEKFQKAIDNALEKDGLLEIDAGTFHVPGGLTIPAALTLRGTNRQKSIIKGGDATVINVTGTEGISFSNFTISGASSILIDVSPSGPHNQFSTLRDLTFVGGSTAISMGNAAWWTIDRCYVYGAAQNGIYVASVSAPDDGDSSITNCILSYPGAASIFQASSGGLRLINNKIIGGIHGYLLELTPDVITSDLIATGNSIENMTNGFVGVWADVDHFANVMIANNQFSNVTYPINMPTYKNMITSPNVIQ